MTRQSYDLGGKVVLITGGTGGIGSATARELLRRGAKVAIVDVDPDTPQIAARMSSHSAMGAVADVRVRTTLDLAVADVVDRFGRIDVAIANAGILSRAATLRTTPTSSIESLLAVNVTGVVNTVQAAMDQVIAHRGQFVLISSVFAFLNGMGTIPYAMSKAAVEQLGRGLRVELADARRLDDDRLLLPHRHQHDQTRRRRRPRRRRTARSPAAGLLKRLQPDAAATALADGLTHRSPRVMAPARWKPISALRGLIAPALDPRLARDRRTLAALAELDARPTPHRDTNAPTPCKAHDPIERHDMTTWKDAPTRTINVDGVDVRLPRTRHRLRRSGGVPAPPDRGPRRLGPAHHRRHRRAPPRDRLRQPRCRRDRRVGATHRRADGRRRDRLHPRPGPRARSTCSGSRSAAASPRWSRCRRPNWSAA